MVEEKENELDDWLEDLEGAEDASEEMDQSDMDALLGGEGEEPKASASSADDSVDSAGENSEEMGQSDIDALLGGGEEGAGEAPAESQASESAEEESVDLDQAELDALLGGGDDAAADSAEASSSAESDSAANDSVDLDQAELDALLGGFDEEDAPAAAEAAANNQSSEEGPGGEEDQAELDALAGGDAATDTTSTKQNEMDKLFADSSDEAEEDPFKSKEVDFAEILGEDEAGDESFNLETEGDFDVDGFGLDEEEKTFVDTPVEEAPPAEELTEILGAEEEETVAVAEEKGASMPAFLAGALTNKAVMGVTAFCLVLLISSVVFFKSLGEKEPEPIVLQEESEQMVEEVAVSPEPAIQPIAANTVPEVASAEYRMKGVGGAITILLTGKDADGDPLGFEIMTPPKHGRLSGVPPSLTYLPNNDFPGEDRFEFRAGDGKEFSSFAPVMIYGPDLSRKKEEKVLVRRAVPVKPKVRATDVVFETVSTEDVVIDWQQIWKLSNSTPYSSKVSVDFDAVGLAGELVRLGPARHLYRPEKYSEGEMVIPYRFKLAGVSSKQKKLRLRIKAGNPPPEIHLEPLAEAYTVGETVVLDASATMDDRRESTVFRWQQTGGVPVQLTALNKEGSIVSFVMPSSFHTEKGQGPVMEVTAVDKTGLQDSKVIQVRPRSRHQTALWRGKPDGGVAMEPPCSDGNCPGGLLPWPYPD